MKKVYSLITLLAATLTATAAGPAASFTPTLEKLTEVAKSSSGNMKLVESTPPVAQLFDTKGNKAKAIQTRNLGTAKDFPQRKYTPAKQGLYFDTDATGEEEVWTSIGTGSFKNSLCEGVGLQAVTYDVEIEETPIEGGKKYRFLPFASAQNPLYFFFKAPDTQNYMVFYVMDDGKNYFEDFKAYGLVEFTHMVEETGWEGFDDYATFVEGVFSIEEMCIAGDFDEILTSPNNYYVYANEESPMIISLPGAKDYSLELLTFNCPEDHPIDISGYEQVYYVSSGADVAYVKSGFVPGYWTFDAENYGEFVSEYGAKYQGGKLSAITVSGDPGIYTAYAGAYNEKDELLSVDSGYFFIQDDDSDNWQEAGTAKWTESLLSTLFRDIPVEELTMTYEEHKEMPGYYRLVNPYATHSMAEVLCTPHASHNHYIYIDATDPERVKIEAGPIGVATSYGSSVVMSKGYYYEICGEDPDEIKEYGYYGTMADNKISFPNSEVMHGMKYYLHGSFLDSDEMEVTLFPTVEATGIKLEKEETTLKAGESETLVATVEPEDATETEVTWTSSDEAVATVDTEGKVTAVAEGTATITATCGEFSATCTVTVEKADEPTPDPTITLDQTSVELTVGQSVTLAATIENPLQTDEAVTWTSDNEVVASVDSEGKVTALAEGNATITASYAGQTVTCTVTVTGNGGIIEDSIDEIKAATGAEAFDLMGRRINGAAKGIVILRSGNKVVKAMVK